LNADCHTWLRRTPANGAVTPKATFFSRSSASSCGTPLSDWGKKVVSSDADTKNDGRQRS
jgi:hypothetical protein